VAAVEVTGSAPMINATDATVGTVIENKQILELPLNGRNFINLVSLSPNVSSDWAGGGGGGASGRQGGDRSTQNFAVAGQRREYNQYTLDGIVNQTSTSIRRVLPSIDSVEEFKVQTGVYSAEFGRGVAQVNVSTKSGTNAYHGTLFEFVRNDAFDAQPYQFTTVSRHRPSSGISMASRWAGRSDSGLTTARTNCSSCPTSKASGSATSRGVFSTPSVAMRNGLLAGRRDDSRSPDGQPFRQQIQETVGPHR
jgi:hypothetical protein